MSDVFSMPVLIGAILVAGICVFVILRACTLPRGARGRASCGACGEPYVGSVTCPACGGDIAQTGVVTPAIVHKCRGSVAAAVVSIVVLAASVGVISALTLDWTCGAMGWILHADQQTYGRLRGPGAHQWPGSADGPLNILISRRVIGRSIHHPQKGDITVIVRDRGYAIPDMREMPSASGAWHAILDVKSDELTIRDPTGTQASTYGGLRVADIETLLKSAKLVLTDDERHAVAAQIVSEMERTSADSPTTLAYPVLVRNGGTRSEQRSLPFAVIGQWGGIGILIVSALAGLATLMVSATAFTLARRRLRRSIAPA
jgi:hypothetical protein